MLGRKREISYTPGRLAKKLGVSKPTVMAHLKKTGLIKDCFRDDNWWWRIPHSVALKISSAESLAVNVPRKQSRKKKSSKRRDDFFDKELEELGLLGFDEYEEAPRRNAVRQRKQDPRSQAAEKVDEDFERCKLVTNVLLNAGYTVADIMNFCQQAKQEAADKNEKKQTTDSE